MSDRGDLKDFPKRVRPDLPVKALSIRQPWAGAIFDGLKTIENRTYRTAHRGPVCIHAGQVTDWDNYLEFITDEHMNRPARVEMVPRSVDIYYATGAIIGIADIVDVIEDSDDPWFVGPYGYVLENIRPVWRIRVSGMLGFFDWRKRLTAEQIRAELICDTKIG